MSTKIDFSEIESGILGLRIARCNNDNFDEALLYNQIVAGKYDLCRVKVAAEDEMASNRLNQMGIPFFFSGSIRRYKTRIAEPPQGSYHYQDLVFEEYDGTQSDLLRQMLVGTWGTYPLGYYRTPYLSQLVTKEKEIESVFQYYKKHNLRANYPNNTIMFIKHGDVHVGFFALNIVDGNLESHIGGILAPFRKSNYFLDMLRYIKEFCIREHLPYFIFGARNENAEVQRIFQFVGFTALGSENVFHVPSLLTYSKTPVLEKQISLNSAPEDELLYKEALAIARQHLNSFRKVSFYLNKGDKDFNSHSDIKIQFTLPVMEKSSLLVVLKGADERAGLLTGYLALS